MKHGEQFSEDYYENGIAKKISGYSDYHYMPTRSYEEASTIKEYYPDVNTVLDYGAAKGYLVHALNQLGYEAMGYDISEYAKEHCHPSVKHMYIDIDEFISDITKTNSLVEKLRDPGLVRGFKDIRFDLVICKDVMEHIPEENVVDVLSIIKAIGKKALFVIPLGDNDQFRIREYEIDITHVTKKDEDWWLSKLREAGFKINNFKYTMGDIKKKWQCYEHGNGFFFVQ